MQRFPYTILPHLSPSLLYPGRPPILVAFGKGNVAQKVLKALPRQRGDHEPAVSVCHQVSTIGQFFFQHVHHTNASLH